MSDTVSAKPHSKTTIKVLPVGAITGIISSWNNDNARASASVLNVLENESRSECITFQNFSTELQVFSCAWFSCISLSAILQIIDLRIVVHYTLIPTDSTPTLSTSSFILAPFKDAILNNNNTVNVSSDLSHPLADFVKLDGFVPISKLEPLTNLEIKIICGGCATNKNYIMQFDLDYLSRAVNTFTDADSSEVRYFNRLMTETN